MLPIVPGTGPVADGNPAPNFSIVYPVQSRSVTAVSARLARVARLVPMRSLSITPTAWKGLSFPLAGWRQAVHDKACVSIRSLANAWPRGYLLLAGLVGLSGYLWLLLFPALVIIGGLEIHAALTGDGGVEWLRAAFWLPVGGLAALVSVRLFRFRPALPAGKAVDGTTHPALLQLVEEQSRDYPGVTIDHVVLTADFALDIVKTPRNAFPAAATTTLLVGVPLLQVLSEQQFQCALARRLGQFSMRYNQLENWLYRMRGIWLQYCDPARRGGTGFQPVAGLFRRYVPVFHLVSEPAAQLDELAADDYAMELFSDEDVRNTITTLAVCQRYLEVKYWPVLLRFAVQNERVLGPLRAGMAGVLRAGLQPGAVDHWLAEALHAGEGCGCTVPSLARRLNNIGFGSAHMEPLAAETAAMIYLP